MSDDTPEELEPWSLPPELLAAFDRHMAAWHRQENVTRRPTIRKVTIDPPEECVFCFGHAELEVEPAAAIKYGETHYVCLNCARQLGHASLGNRTWKPPE